jgi:hypothetical protein
VLQANDFGIPSDTYDLNHINLSVFTILDQEPRLSPYKPFPVVFLNRGGDGTVETFDGSAKTVKGTELAMMVVRAAPTRGCSLRDA